MKTSLKAVLLSGLVFPGLGQLALKCYISGMVMILSTSIALYFLIGDTLTKVNQVLTQIQSGRIPLTADAISKALLAPSSGLTMQTLSEISYLLGVIWIISIIDAYRISRRLSHTVEHA